MTHGSIEWIEIPAHDMDALPAFYEAVFGWKVVRDENFPGYAMFEDTSGHVGGGFYTLIQPAKEGGPLVYITVDDIAPVLELVAAHGGTCLQGSTCIDEEVGWWASFRDPAGNHMRLHQRIEKG